MRAGRGEYFLGLACWPARHAPLPSNVLPCDANSPTTLRCQGVCRHACFHSPAWHFWSMQAPCTRAYTSVTYDAFASQDGGKARRRALMPSRCRGCRKMSIDFAISRHASRRQSHLTPATRIASRCRHAFIATISSLRAQQNAALPIAR